MAHIIVLAGGFEDQLNIAKSWISSGIPLSNEKKWPPQIRKWEVWDIVVSEDNLERMIRAMSYFRRNDFMKPLRWILRLFGRFQKIKPFEFPETNFKREEIGMNPDNQWTVYFTPIGIRKDEYTGEHEHL